MDEDVAVITDQLKRNLQSIAHEGKPARPAEAVVVAEVVALGVERWIDVDRLDLSAEAFAERHEGQEVVAVDEEVVAMGEARGRLLPVTGDPPRLGEDLRSGEAVDLIGGEVLVVEDLGPALLLLRLATFEPAVLVGPHELDVAALGDAPAGSVHQADRVREAGEAVG